MPSKAADLWWLFTRQTVTVTENQTVFNAALLMEKRNFRHLPVISENGKIVGVISAQDIIDSLNFVMMSYGSSKEVIESMNIPVERIMTPHTISVEPGDGLSEIAKKVSFNNIGALPVVNEQGVVQGIITLRDLVGLMGISSAPLNVRVSEIMNTKVTCIGTDARLSDAVKLMSEHRIRRLPIISHKEELLGIFTNKDVLRHLAEIHMSKTSEDEFDIKISDFMTRDVITISQEDDIRVAASRMMIFGVGGLAVDDLTTPRMALVTERDLIRTLSRRKGIPFLVSSMQYESEAESESPEGRRASL